MLFLIENKISFSPMGRRVRSFLKVALKKLLHDKDVGFAKTNAGKFFGVFQRLHRADEFEGIGIGVVNVHRFKDRRGWGQGKIDQGATFYFSLPKSGQAD